MKKNILIIPFIVLVMLLSACGKATVTEPAIGSATKTSMPVETVADASPTARPSPVPQNMLPAGPQNVTFQTPQGRTLSGRYFPAAVENAPVVVLIHWVMANQDDWQTVAAWLQNRGQVLTGTCSTLIPCPWWDSSWFPFMDQRSFAVFTLTLSGCEPNDGCKNWSGPAWVEDANAGIQYASQLEGVDPARIVTAGASIGADAAIDSCAWLDQQGGTAHCVGTFAFSPGNYLGLSYSAQVTSLEGNSVPAWCLFAEGDGEAAPTCQSASGTNYQMFEYAGNDHGMMLIKPDLTPKDSPKTTLEIFLEFLDLTLTP